MRTLVQIGEENELVYAFKAGGTIAFNKPVSLSAANTVTLATNEKIVGWTLPDAEFGAKNEADEYVSGDLAKVRLEGEIFEAEAGGVFAVGDYVKVGTGGKLVEEVDGAVRTENTKGIALEAGSDGAWVRVMRLR